MSDYWCKLDVRFAKDDKVEAIGERFGPAGPLAMVVLLLNAKAQNKGGKVDGTYRDLAHDVYIDREQSAELLEALVEIGFAEGELNGRNFKLFLPAFKRWNDRQRKQEQRERERDSEECHNSVTTCHDLSQNVTKNRLDKSRNTKDVEAVFNAWVAATERDPKRTKLTAARRSLIERSLKDYPVEDLVDAVRGIAASDFHRGENDRGKRFDTLEVALRGSNIEGFRDDARGDGKRAAPSSLDYDPLIDG